MTEQSLQILGVPLNGTNLAEVLEKIRVAIKNEAKLVIFTPNPEFLVLASRNPAFKNLLNQSDINIPDGIGLIWASKFLKTKPLLKNRVAGVDLVSEIFQKGQESGWKIGVVGNRRGDIKEATKQIEILRQKFSNLQIANYQENERYDLILACQGMGEQERWVIDKQSLLLCSKQSLLLCSKQSLSLRDNGNKVMAKVFVGIGGSLDLISEFTKRAPRLIREIGLEWLWRLVHNPKKHFARVVNAIIVFPWLVIREKLKTMANGK